MSTTGLQRVELAGNMFTWYLAVAMLFAPIVGLVVTIPIWIGSWLAGIDVGGRQCYAAGWLVTTVLMIADMRQFLDSELQPPEEMPDRKNMN